MTNEPVRVVFHLDPDPLLLSVLRSAVLFQALQAGLSTGICNEFAQASEDVCRETISQLKESGGPLDVTVDTFHDRIEIAIHHHGQMAPAVGLETFASAEALAVNKGGFSGLELLSRVDRVLFSSEAGVARTTLVKFLYQKK